MGTYTDDEISKMKKKINYLSGQRSGLQTKKAKILELQTNLKNNKESISKLNTTAKTIIDLSEDGKACFIKGACYCGEEIGSSEVFQNINDYFKEYMEKIESICGTLDDKIELCDTSITNLGSKISGISTEIDSLNRKINNNE